VCVFSCHRGVENKSGRESEFVFKEKRESESVLWNCDRMEKKMGERVNL